MGVLRKLTSVLTLGLVDFLSDEERAARSARLAEQAVRARTEEMRDLGDRRTLAWLEQVVAEHSAKINELVGRVNELAGMPPDQPPEAIVETQPSRLVKVILSDVGPKKIQVIKEIRGLTDLGLAKAKALAESAPSVVLASVDEPTALAAARTLEGAGALVEIQDGRGTPLGRQGGDAP